MIPEIPAPWKKIIPQDLYHSIGEQLNEECKSHTIYPEAKDWFRAFEMCPPKKVKVLILGQDPYHGPNQAHGLAFSVNKGQKIPPSLRNIFKELHTDLGASIPNHGDLSAWAEQGVLLMNCSLTVRAAEAGSHQQLGWQEITKKVFETLALDKTPKVFILWGKWAQAYTALFPEEHPHCILSSAHPSPLSARHGFFGSKPFSKCNAFLKTKGINPIDWKLNTTELEQTTLMF